MLIRSIELRCSLAAADNQKRSIGDSSCDVLSDPAPVKERDGEKREEAEKQDGTAWPHRLIERRCRIDQHGAEDSRRGNGKNMLDRVGKSALVHIAIVSADDVKRLHDHDQLKQVDQLRELPLSTINLLGVTHRSPGVYAPREEIRSTICLASLTFRRPFSVGSRSRQPLRHSSAVERTRGHGSLCGGCCSKGAFRFGCAA